MRRHLSGLALSLCVSTLAYGDESMSKRMQSVVDEVIELRQRYEHSLEKNRACMEQVDAQQKTMKKISHEQGYDYELFEKNRKRLSLLEAENSALKKRPQSSCADEKKKSAALSKEIEVIKRENQRLLSSAEILVEKNHALLEQVTKLKQAGSDANAEQVNTKHVEALQLENTQLNEVNKGLIIKMTALETQVRTGEKELKTSIVPDDRYTAIQNELQKQKEKNIKLQESSRLIEENLHEKLAAVQKELAVLQEKSALEYKTGDCKPKKVITICKDDNPFPQLMMKEPKNIQPLETDVQMVIEVKKAPAVMHRSVRVTTEKASVYRMNKEAKVYDIPQGKVIDNWEEKTSFTSNVSEGEWIKITGFFVDRKWQKADKEMWVKVEDTVKR